MERIKFHFTIGDKSTYWEPKQLKKDMNKDKINEFTEEMKKVAQENTEMPIARIQGVKPIQPRKSRNKPDDTRKNTPKPKPEEDTQKVKNKKEPEKIGANGFIATPKQIETHTTAWVAKRFKAYVEAEEFTEKRQDFYLANLQILKLVLGILEGKGLEKHYYFSTLAQIYRQHQWTAVMCAALTDLLEFFLDFHRSTLLKRLKNMNRKLRTKMLRSKKDSKKAEVAAAESMNENETEKTDLGDDELNWDLVLL